MTLRVANKTVIAHHQPININQSKVRATLESSSENSIGNSSVAKKHYVIPAISAKQHGGHSGMTNTEELWELEPSYK